LRLGEIAQAIYYSTVIATPPDVDAVPLPSFTAPRVMANGTIELRFNDAGVLANCPLPPVLQADQSVQNNLRWMELREAAWKLGIDPDAVQVPK
jgi:hypothetical protein